LVDGLFAVLLDKSLPASAAGNLKNQFRADSFPFDRAGSGINAGLLTECELSDPASTHGWRGRSKMESVRRTAFRFPFFGSYFALKGNMMTFDE
jgi:hypothetical protein